MHTEQTANFSVRAAFEDLGLGGADVVWMPSPDRTLDRFQLRRAPGPLSRSAAGAAGAVGPGRGGGRWSQAERLFVHPGGHHLPPGPGGRAAAESAVTLGSLRLFGCGGAPVPPSLVDAAAERGIQVLRLYGSTEVLVGDLEPARNRPRPSGGALTGAR